jgi:hypothetical protein
VIGNTDRHQNNWGIVFEPSSYPSFRPSPAFDSGTALGHELLEEKFRDYESAARRTKYLSDPKKARHHLKWALSDAKPINFFDFMAKLISAFPQTETEIRDRLDFTRKDVTAVLQGLPKLITHKTAQLTEQRLTFTINLIMDRRAFLLETLDH